MLHFALASVYAYIVLRLSTRKPGFLNFFTAVILFLIDKLGAMPELRAV